MSGVDPFFLTLVLDLESKLLPTILISCKKLEVEMDFLFLSSHDDDRLGLDSKVFTREGLWGIISCLEGHCNSGEGFNATNPNRLQQ